MNLSPAPNGKDFWDGGQRWAGARRLLVLGDSVALGGDRDGWVWRLGPQLRGAVGKKLPLWVRVAARPGWGSAQRLSAWRRHRAWLKGQGESPPGAGGQAAAVLWVVSLNDLLDESTVVLNGAQTRVSGVCRQPASQCARLLNPQPVTGLLTWWGWRRAQQKNLVSLQTLLKQSRGVAATRRALAAFGREADGPGVQALVVVMPYLWPRPSPFAPVNEQAAALARRAGLPVLDLTGVLAPLPVEKQRCRPSDYVHPALGSHPAIAAEVAGELSRWGW